MAPRLEVRRLGASDEQSAVSAALGPFPARNAFLIGWIAERGTLPVDLSDSFAFFVAGRGAIDAVALVAGGRVVSLSAGDIDACKALGAACRRSFGELQTFIGPELEVEAFWEAWADARVTPRLIQRQTVFAMRPRDLRYIPEPSLTTASVYDVEELAAASCQMHTEETGLPLSDTLRGQYEWTVADHIGAQRMWILRDPVNNELLFKASVPAVSTTVVQVEGVWVPPHRRRQGIARRALSELCRRLLMETGMVSLYANRTNIGARQLYLRLGFREIAPFVTMRLGD
jgi:GNAT superfamily N-acetyltransferase